MERRFFLQLIPGLAALPFYSDLADKNPNLFDKLLEPFLREADRLRAKRLVQDPEYQGRVDWKLNDQRVNFLLFDHGLSNRVDLIGSQTLFSYNPKRRLIDIISISNDIRAPEIERFLEKPGMKVAPITIDKAYGTGGSELQRKVVESAFGLSVDFQAVLSDEGRAALIDFCFGTVEVTIPETFKANDVYFRDGEETKKIAGRVFEQGTQRLNGEQASQFIKSADPILEHTVRKPLILAGILNETARNAWDPRFWMKVNSFTKTGWIEADFDIQEMFGSNIIGLIGSLIKAPFDGTRLTFSPRFNKAIYIVDQKEGDPLAENLILDYWGAPQGTRAVVKRLLATTLSE